MKRFIHNHFCTNYLVISYRIIHKIQADTEEGPICKKPKVTPLLSEESVACLKLSIQTNKTLILHSYKEI